MGFTDEQKNLNALVAVNGNVEAVCRCYGNVTLYWSVGTVHIAMLNVARFKYMYLSIFSFPCFLLGRSEIRFAENE